MENNPNFRAAKLIYYNQLTNIFSRMCQSKFIVHRYLRYIFWYFIIVWFKEKSMSYFPVPAHDGLFHVYLILKGMLMDRQSLAIGNSRHNIYHFGNFTHHTPCTEHEIISAFFWNSYRRVRETILCFSGRIIRSLSTLSTLSQHLGGISRATWSLLDE